MSYLNNDENEEIANGLRKLFGIKKKKNNDNTNKDEAKDNNEKKKTKTKKKKSKSFNFVTLIIAIFSIVIMYIVDFTLSETLYSAWEEVREEQFGIKPTDDLIQDMKNNVEVIKRLFDFRNRF